MAATRTGGRILPTLDDLDPGHYTRHRDDPSALVRGLIIVVFATLLAAAGGFLWAWIGVTPPEVYEVDLERFVRHSVIYGSLIQVGMWAMWVVITWLFLRHIFFIDDATLPALFRTMGFAFAPMAIQILMFVAVLEFPIGMVAIATTLACSVLAVRAATRATPAQAVYATAAGFAVFALALGILGNWDSDLAPGIFSIDPTSSSISMKSRLTLD